MHKFLIIQTAFTGDVVLATALVEKLHGSYPGARIDFLLRKGNEGLLQGHPHIGQVLVWDKKHSKNINLLKMAMRVKSEQYTHVVNVHRFASSGLITMMSGAAWKAGFDKNPFSFCYNRKVVHKISEAYDPKPVHEVERNQQLIAEITDGTFAFPALYPSDNDVESISRYQLKPYICIAPASVWFTKQFPAEQWVSLANDLPAHLNVYVIGAPTDADLGNNISTNTTNRNVVNLCGKLNYLQSAELMKGAAMNYANDSAPLHMASAVHAPVTAVFCSTVPAFGFGPLRDNATVVEIKEKLYCRPCGLHGHRKCPEGHFRCALDIKNEQLLWWISRTT